MAPALRVPAARLAGGMLALCVAAALAGPASAAAPYIIADVTTGKVIESQDATMPWYPASVTKLMTAYVALRQVKAGRIGMETAIPVSKRAASAAPSKIGARPGTEVTLENALKMILVKSANDMAVVIAEGVGGSVENFAAMMNAEAQRIGMRESRFYNPHGLFIEGQQTSARDMAILARTILLEFPEYRTWFSINAIQLGKRVMRNTNGLVGRYPGIEGMKTGFICASGFNLVAVANRGGQRLIAVVFGTASGSERAIRAAQLLDKGFSGGGSSFFGGSASSLEALPASGVARAPNMREDICVRRRGPPPSEDEFDTAAAVAFPNPTSDNDRFPVMAMASPAATAQVRGPGRTLGPRADVEPEIVTLGRTAGSAGAPVAANAPGGTAVAVRPGRTPAAAFTGDAPVAVAVPSAVTAAPAGAVALTPAARGSIGTGAASRAGGAGAIAPGAANPWMQNAAAPAAATPRPSATPPKPTADTKKPAGGKAAAKPAAKPAARPAPATPASAKPAARTAAKPAPAQ